MVHLVATKIYFEVVDFVRLVLIKNK